jgi:hypothetical protein
VFNNPALVQTIYFVAGSLFLGGLFLGALTTIARVVYYRIHRTARPRLLTRDLIVYGGLALSFGLITLVRFLPVETRQQVTTGNVLWAIATTVPAVLAVLYYCYIEIFVIGHVSDEPLALEASVQDNIAKTEAVDAKVDELAEKLAQKP